ncbi:MAG: serine/threonine-protein kinase [Polyangiaceae bacterium]
MLESDDALKEIQRAVVRRAAPGDPAATMGESDVFGLCGAVLEGKYRVDSVVGEGGFGVVYRGFHLTFEHDIAIKCLKVPGHFTAEAKKLFFEKFREEGKLLSKLSSAHLSIVRVYDFGVAQRGEGSVPFMVLEWLRGVDLERHLADHGPFSERDAIALLRPAIDALALAHKQGIAHRDIKPQNLYVADTPDGPLLKVLDFGIAKAMHEGETATQLTTRTSSGFSAFSPRHGAPEQFRAKRFGATGPWTDVHALGLCLVELVTGRAALEGEEHADFFEASTNEARPTPRAKGATVSDAFEALCARALSLKPSDRFQSAGELLAELDRVGSNAPAAGAVAPSRTIAAEPLELPSEEPPRRAKRTRRRGRELGETELADAPPPMAVAPTAIAPEKTPPRAASPQQGSIDGGRLALIVVSALVTGAFVIYLVATSGKSTDAPAPSASISAAPSAPSSTNKMGPTPRSPTPPPPTAKPTGARPAQGQGACETPGRQCLRKVAWQPVPQSKPECVECCGANCVLDENCVCR